MLTRKALAVSRLGAGVLGTVVVCGCLSAQAPTAGEQTRGDSGQQSYNAPGATYNSKGSPLAKPVKARAIVKAVDLERRLVTVVPVKAGRTFRTAELGTAKRVWSKTDKLELMWLTPAGTEKIKATKKAAKILGKKQLQLQDLKAGSKIRVEYYPVSGEAANAPGKAWGVVEMTVEEPAS